MNANRILVVEDEVVVAMDIIDRLQNLGYIVVGQTVSGEDALVLAEQLCPELVLMDIRLQGQMDGIVAAGLIRERFHRPVVFLTANSDDTTLERAKRVEPLGFLLKPFEERDLKTAVEMALHKHKAEVEIHRLNRLYAVLSHVNQALVRAPSREGLFPQVCRALAEQGGFGLAWIGWLDPETRAVRPVAQWGEQQGYLAESVFLANDRPEGRGPTGVAVGQGRVSVCNDIAHDPRMVPWQAAAARAGLRSSGAFPLRCQGQVVGAVNLCSTEAGFFQDRETSLLEELALDLSHALDHLELERRRRRSQSELDATYTSAPIMMCLLDREGRARRLNQAALEFAGRPEGELLGRGVGEVLGCHTAQNSPSGCGFGAECAECRLRQAIVQTLASGQSQRRIECRATLGRSGRPYEATLLGSTARIELPDETMLLLCLEDITIQARLETQLRRARKMEAIGLLAGGVAHDFNNILGAMIGHAELALLDLPPAHPARARLEGINQASHRAAEMVRQILTFSGHQEPRRQPLSLLSVVREVLQLLRATLPAAIELASDLPADGPAVLADPGQIHQVLMNLCTNAWHAVPAQGGRIEIALGTITVEPGPRTSGPELQAGPYARLTVRDNGSGMTPATLERIFEPFYTTRPTGQGTGLGLSVVHGIVKNHDGAIVVTSEPGRGTTFEIYLPVCASQLVEQDRPAAPIPRGQGERVLLVDDEAALASLAQRMLEGLGYQVTARTSPQQASETFQAQPDRWDLLVTDLQMPGLGGVELARQCLRLRPDLPVVLTSGWCGELTSEAVRALGLRALVQKPFTSRELGEAVHRALLPPQPETPPPARDTNSISPTNSTPTRLSLTLP